VVCPLLSLVPVLSCYRYIELNPVRTAIVKDPMDYRWSSYPRNAWGRLDLWVTEQREYTALGADRSSRAAAYRELFTVDMDAELLDEIRRN
jgi:putative transposase